MMSNDEPLSISGLKLFFALLLTCLAISNSLIKLFTHHHGRIHRISGLFHLLWLIYGTFFIVNNNNNYPKNNNNHHHYWHFQCLLYDTILGISGITITLTAAYAFPHKHVHNRPGESGTLAKNAIVTQGEMMEHSFYQGLNLLQALYLHLITWGSGDDDDDDLTFLMLSMKRFGMLLLVTLPWAVRKRFPVNSFSANWKSMEKNQRQEKVMKYDNDGIQVGTEKGSKYLWLINGMYRFKKWQYVFYKHVILHGLNISVGIAMKSDKDDDIPLPLTSQWRIFWLLLNTSYVMEFFLQSLVKRRVISQKFMMVLNALLMISASLASMDTNVLGQVRIETALISLFFNFYNRGYDVFNTLATFVIVHFISNFIITR